MLDRTKSLLLALLVLCCGPVEAPGGTTDTETTGTTDAPIDTTSSSSASRGITHQVTTNNGGSEGGICTDYETCLTENTLTYNDCDADCLVTYGQDASCIKFACEAKCGTNLLVGQLACGETYPECAARPDELLRCRLQCMADSEVCFAPPHCPSDDSDPAMCVSLQKTCLTACAES